MRFRGTAPSLHSVPCWLDTQQGEPAVFVVTTGNLKRILVLHAAVPGVLAGVDIERFDRSVKHCSWRDVRILARFY